MKKRYLKCEFLKKTSSFIKARIKEPIFAAIAGLIIAAIGFSYSHIYQAIQTRFSDVEYDLRGVTAANEFIFNDCINGDSPQKVDQNISLLRTRLEKMVQDEASLGKFMSLKTYCMLHPYTRYSDDIQTQGSGICINKNFKLISKTELYDWLNAYLINQLDNNRRSWKLYTWSLLNMITPSAIMEI